MTNPLSAEMHRMRPSSAEGVPRGLGGSEAMGTVGTLRVRAAGIAT